MFISLKPLAERGGPHHRSASSTACAGRWPACEGIDVFMTRLAGHPRRRAPGPRRSTSSRSGAPRFDDALRLGAQDASSGSRQVPGLVDVSSDREQGGLQANITIDRQSAARASACASRTSTTRSTTPSPSARSRPSTRSATSTASILEVDPRFQRDPSDLSRIFVPGRDGAQVPLTSRDPRRQGAGAAGRQPPGPVPGRHHQLQSQAGDDAGRGDSRRSARRSPSCGCPTPSAPRPPATPRPSPSRPTRSRC